MNRYHKNAMKIHRKASKEVGICLGCEYFGLCQDDPQKPDYCPLPKLKKAKLEEAK